jgi:hypothetical protein
MYVLLVVDIFTDDIYCTLDALHHHGGSTITSSTRHDRWIPGVICGGLK